MMTKDKSHSPDSGITEDIEMVDIITTREDIQEEGDEPIKLRLFIKGRK